MKITNCLGVVEGDFSARHSRFVKGNLKNMSSRLALLSMRFQVYQSGLISAVLSIDFPV